MVAPTVSAGGEEGAQVVAGEVLRPRWRDGQLRQEAHQSAQAPADAGGRRQRASTAVGPGVENVTLAGRDHVVDSRAVPPLAEQRPGRPDQWRTDRPPLVTRPEAAALVGATPEAFSRAIKRATQQPRTAAGTVRHPMTVVITTAHWYDPLRCIEWWHSRSGHGPGRGHKTPVTSG
ncbi:MULTISPECIES: hypothetical protein [unclassified Streptomyces]|uniref:hypothetical protein n=1 Tax=unclassified Streptomyces TaxID=2593676 RepID=UPI00081E1DB9|nr:MULTISPECIES: hypothetical protein [unclassified Streptomyces]MYZ37359.1 hypothetical protein [Streptomyces sp. SID4917]SCF90739.1 hypothetical protein GA0115259_1046311 [Streptomyces sp. MnatMP-M17]